MQWARLLPKARFLSYFKILVDTIRNLTDPVLIYDYTRCVHELIKEIDAQIKKS